MANSIKELKFNIEKHYSVINGKAVVVGIFDEEVAEYASYNNKGTDTIPARPFIDHFVSDKQDVIFQSLQAFFSSGVDSSIIDKIGQKASAELKLYIRDNSWIPNAINTIAQKGSSRPLIDTGRMINSIDYKVER